MPRDKSLPFNMACVADAVISVDPFCSDYYEKKCEDIEMQNS
jgi:hypothetical protein